MLLQRITWLLASVSLAVGVGVGSWWLLTQKSSTPKADKPAPPAAVSKIAKEDELTTITLTEEAEKRLGIKIAPVEKRPTKRVRIYGGEVMIPIGKTVLVAAPVGGTLRSPSSGMVKAGQRVKSGQIIFQLLPLLTPEGRATLSASLVDTDGAVNNAKTSVDAAKIALDRASRLFQEDAGSKRTVDETQAAYDLAMKTLEAAQARRSILSKVVGELEQGTAAAIPIESPEDGIVRNVSALPGQNVPSGGALFEIVDLTTIWIRVPVSVNDLDELARTEPAQAGKLSSSMPGLTMQAKPVVAPPSANAIAATVDVFYELPNPNEHYIPGQRLGVSIPLKEAAESLVIPWSSIVFDINGGTWVYEQVGDRKFTRKRVTIHHTVDAIAVLGNGPSPGTKIISEGAAEVFGAETGFVK
jgi:membrane fusion protein, heavy metal efflux system